MADDLRLDHYLHRARLFKSRTQATDACRDGRVLVNGKSAKSSSEVHEGDQLDIREKGLYRTIRIVTLPGKNMSKEAARETWRDETPEDIRLQREQVNQANRQRLGNQEGARPTKKERRKIDRFRGR